MTKEQIVKALERAGSACVGFSCPFGMFGQNKEGAWGCFAKYPDGDPACPSQGCVASQAAKIIREGA